MRSWLVYLSLTSYTLNKFFQNILIKSKVASRHIPIDTRLDDIPSTPKNEPQRFFPDAVPKLA